MDLLVIIDNYPPLTNSGAIIVSDLVEELYRQNHHVTVVTFINSTDSENKTTVTQESSATVIRIPIGNKKRNRMSRALIERSYSRKIIKTLREETQIKYNAIIFYSPSIFFGSAVAWAKKKKRGIKSYLICRDIFPKWALDVGLLKKNIIYYYFKYIEKKLYDSADIIGYESNRDDEYFKQMTIKKKTKLEVLNNWSSDFLQPPSSQSEILDINKINIVYGGNTGDAQDLLTLIELIDLEQFSGKVVLTVIGHGSQYKLIDKHISASESKNIILHKSMEKHKYLEVLAQADIGLLSLNAKLKSHSYPLKMLNYMQLGKPLFAVVNAGNEIINLIERERIGIAAISGNPNSINQALKKLIEDREYIQKAGMNALDLFKRKFSVESAAKQIINSLNNL